MSEVEERVKPDTPCIKVGVTLSCGHGFTETRPAGTVLPVNGEQRVCGDFEHYPQQFRATYSEPIEVR